MSYDDLVKAKGILDLIIELPSFEAELGEGINSSKCAEILTIDATINALQTLGFDAVCSHIIQLLSKILGLKVAPRVQRCKLHLLRAHRSLEGLTA